MDDTLFGHNNDGGKKSSLVNLVIAVSSFAPRGFILFLLHDSYLSSIYWLAGHLVTGFILERYSVTNCALGGQL